MARDWLYDHEVADHRDIQANTLAIDHKGQYALLAGRRHLGIIQLDDPAVTLCKINRHSKWDVTTAQWSLHQPQLSVIACNQRAEIFSWAEGNLTPHSTLKAHTRAISDLDWAKFDENLLATSSVDTNIHLWDIREHRKPCLTLSAVAAASQVKWNKLSQHVLATSHEGDIRLWDSRRGSSPVQYITAHLSKIHGIDWSPNQENELVTASQDNTVKFWDVSVPQKKDDMILQCPVWRARFTPFGHGLITVVLPPLRRGDNTLFMWNLQNLSNPVHTFRGHSDVVVEFGWRKISEDHKDYKLVTWSKDHSLRIWNVDIHLQRSCGVSDCNEEEEPSLYPVKETKEYISSTSQTSARETDFSGNFSTPPTTPSRPNKKDLVFASGFTAQPQNLKQEFSLVNLNIPNMTIVEMNASKRCCTVTAESGQYIVCLKMQFPAMYPNNAAPTFTFSEDSNVDKALEEKLLQVLQMTSQQQVRRNRSCLEPCLRQLAQCLDNFSAEEVDQQQLSNSPYHRDPVKPFFPLPHYAFQDVSVPFPRTSGARFCGADKLVVFTRPLHLQRINAPTDVTPRSLSALAAYLSSHVIPMKPRTHTTASSPAQYNLVYQSQAHSPSGENSVSISSFYHQDRKQKMRRSNTDRQSSGSKTQSSGAVFIFSVAKLIPVNKILAQNYVLYPNNPYAACVKNANISAAEGFKDLVQIWTLAALVCAAVPMPSFGPNLHIPWAHHPCGQKLIQSLITYFVQKQDVQTAAMLTCIFHTKVSNKALPKKVGDVSSGSSGSVSQLLRKWWLKPGGSPYHTVVPADNASETWIMVGAALKKNRSNSWSDSLEEYRLMEGQESRDIDKDYHESHTRLLDPKMIFHYDQLKKAYADILYRWNLLEQRAQILKYVSYDQPEKGKSMDCITECLNCHKDIAGPQCPSCKNYSLSCIVCHLSVKGLSSFCIACGHGGHASHMEEWFRDADVCPSGCGCRCLEESNILGT